MVLFNIVVTRFFKYNRWEVFLRSICFIGIVIKFFMIKERVGFLIVLDMGCDRGREDL